MKLFYQIFWFFFQTFVEFEESESVGKLLANFKTKTAVLKGCKLRIDRSNYLVLQGKAKVSELIIKNWFSIKIFQQKITRNRLEGKNITKVKRQKQKKKKEIESVENEKIKVDKEETEGMW